MATAFVSFCSALIWRVVAGSGKHCGVTVGLAVVIILKDELWHPVLVEMPFRSAKGMARPVCARLRESADANFVPIGGNARHGQPVGERLRISMESGKEES